MFGKKSSKDKTSKIDKYATQENPVLIFQPLSNVQIVVGNLDEDDEYKTEPFPPQKQK